MNRFILSAAALIMAATACTESGLIDTPEMYNGLIVFNTYVGKTPVTKALNTDIDQMKGASGGAHIYSFMCDEETNAPEFGSTFMDGSLVYGTTSWEYKVGGVSEVVYWPGTSKLAFVAYNLAADNCINSTTQTSTGFDFTVNQNVASQVDLVATGLDVISGATNGEDTQVTLSFKHLLSRVGFKVLATHSSDAAITISSVKLRGVFPKTGHVDLTLSAPSISPITSGNNAHHYEYSLFAEDDDPFVINSSECVTGTEDDPIGPQPIYARDVNNRYMMIMPGPQSNASIEVVYQLTGEESPNTAVLPLGNDWNFTAGLSYEFILKISTASIEFDATMSDDWNTNIDGNNNTNDNINTIK